jgi:hypothetical protein
LIFCAFALAVAAGPTYAIGTETQIPVAPDAPTADAEVNTGDDDAADTVVAKPGLLNLDSKSIDVLVDVLLVNDIGGKIDGVYEDANVLLLSAIDADVRKVTANNTEIADVLLTNGMLLGDGDNLVYASAGKATATPFKRHATDTDKNVFLSAESAAFFLDVVRKSTEGYRRATHFDVVLPSGGLNGDSRYLLFVQSSARHVPASKTFGVALATGLVSAAVGGAVNGALGAPGPAQVSFFMPMSGGSVTVALIDKQESKVLWAKHHAVKDFDQIQVLSKRMVYGFSRALPAGSQPAVAERVDTTGFKNLREAKIALKAAKITKPLYYAAQADLQNAYRAALEKLKVRKQSGEISDAAFEILAVQAMLDYTGG